MKKGLWTVGLAIVVVSCFMFSVPASWAHKGPHQDLGPLAPLRGHGRKWKGHADGHGTLPR